MRASLTNEIAKVLKTSVSSVKSLLFRARAQLKVHLANYLAEPD